MGIFIKSAEIDTHMCFVDLFSVTKLSQPHYNSTWFLQILYLESSYQQWKPPKCKIYLVHILWPYSGNTVSCFVFLRPSHSCKENIMGSSLTGWQNVLKLQRKLESLHPTDCSQQRYRRASKGEPGIIVCHRCGR